MNSNIFNIQEEYLRIVNELEVNDGELTPELEEALKINEEERDAKFEAYIYVIKQYQADNELAKDEIARLRSKTASNEKVISRLKKTMISAMELFGLNGKSGNLSHRVSGFTMFTKDTESINVKVESIGEAEEHRYASFLDFVIKSKLTKYQIDKIEEFISTNFPEVEVKHEAAISKEKFKAKYYEAASMENEVERELLAEVLGEAGEIVTNKTLIIK